MKTPQMMTSLPDPLLYQAETVLDLLERQTALPVGLKLDIEEAVEAAWEIAYRRPTAVVIALGDVRDRRAARSG